MTQFGKITATAHEQFEPPPHAPLFNFDDWVFIQEPNTLPRVKSATASEVRYLWTVCDLYGSRFRGAIDCGANIGSMTYAMALLYDRIWALEPWPANFRALETNSVRFPASDIMLLEKAAGAENKLGTMYSSHKSRRDAHLEEAPKGKKGDAFTVDVVKLDTLIPLDTPIDLIKLDVEGTEIDVLRGAARIIDTYRPLIFAEFKQPDKVEGVGFMESIGYKQLGVSGHNYIFGEK